MSCLVGRAPPRSHLIGGAHSWPNLDILGAPIGDYLHDLSLIAGKSRKLLLVLVDVAAVVLQVAVTLLCMCVSFCRIVHIARASHTAWL